MAGDRRATAARLKYQEFAARTAVAAHEKLSNRGNDEYQKTGFRPKGRGQ